MKLIRFSVAALLLCLVFACNSSADNRLVQEVAADQAAPMPDKKNEEQKPPQQPNTTTTTHQDWDKKIIKNASLHIEVADYDAYNQQVHNNLKQWGGYIAQEEQKTTEYQKENTIFIKVPVDQFDNIVQSLSSGKDKVLVKRITSEDVTGEMVDTRARMEAKRQIRERYMDFLKQAKNMEEILQVQNVINDIQVQIESATGRVNYLTHASAFSTIQLTFFQVIRPGAPEEPKTPSFGFRVLDSLKNGLMWVGELLLLVLNLWPLLLLGGFIYWSFKRWRTTRVKTGN